MTMRLCVRRSLLGVRGAALWTPALPTSDGGYLPEHWYRSDQGLWQDAGVTPAVNDGDVVGRWEDITANADHVNQAAAGNKPTLQNGAGDLLNGHPVIRLDGINDYLVGAFTTGGAMNQPNTYFVVVQLDAAVVNNGLDCFLLDGDDAVNRHIVMKNKAGAPDRWDTYAGVALVGGDADANWNVWTALYNGATSQFWLNGISEAGPANAGAQNPDGIAVGAQSSGATAWKGDITEIILYDANLSDADKNQVGAYLATRYALAYTDI